MAARAPKVQKVMVQPIVSFLHSYSCCMRTKGKFLIKARVPFVPFQELDFQILANKITSGHLAL